MNDLTIYTLAKTRLDEIHAEAALARLANQLRKQRSRHGAPRYTCVMAGEPYQACALGPSAAEESHQYGSLSLDGPAARNRVQPRKPWRGPRITST
jgi:hypothetical protein